MPIAHQALLGVWAVSPDLSLARARSGRDRWVADPRAENPAIRGKDFVSTTSKFLTDSPILRDIERGVRVIPRDGLGRLLERSAIQPTEALAESR